VATIYTNLWKPTGSPSGMIWTDYCANVETIERVSRRMWHHRFRGVMSGWTACASSRSTVAAGYGCVGGLFASTAATQAVSGLANGTNYVFAKTKNGTAASGTIQFVGRATSAAIANYDAVTSALLIGKFIRAVGAVTSTYNAPRTYLYSYDWVQTSVAVNITAIQSGASKSATYSFPVACRMFGSIYKMIVPASCNVELRNQQTSTFVYWCKSLKAAGTTACSGAVGRWGLRGA